MAGSSVLMGLAAVDAVSIALRSARSHAPYSITGTRESRHVAIEAAAMISAPPSSGQKPGASWWTSQAHSGLNAGSASSEQ